jgi:hypothetical protein
MIYDITLQRMEKKLKQSPVFFCVLTDHEMCASVPNAQLQPLFHARFGIGSALTYSGDMSENLQDSVKLAERDDWR